MTDGIQALGRRRLALMGLGAGVALIGQSALPRAASAKGSGIHTLLAAASQKAKTANAMMGDVASKQRSLVREVKDKKTSKGKAEQLSDQQGKTLVKLSRTLKEMEAILAQAERAFKKDCG